MHGEVEQLGLVAHEQHREGCGEQLRGCEHGKARESDHDEAAPEEAPHLARVARPEVVAHERRAAYGIADEDRVEREAEVQNDAVGRHARIAQPGEQLHVEGHRDERRRDVGDELRRSVEAGLREDGQVDLGLDEAQAARVGTREVYERDRRGKRLAGDGRDGGAGDAHAHGPHEDRIERDVGDACSRGVRESHAGLAGGCEEVLEEQLAGIEGQAYEQDRAVGHGELEHLPLGAEGHHEGAQEDEAHDGERDGEDDVGDREEGEALLGELFVARAARARHDGAAAGAEHEAHGCEEHGDWPDEVHRGERGRARPVGDEEAVRHHIERFEEHHPDGRQGGAEEPPHREML